MATSFEKLESSLEGYSQEQEGTSQAITELQTVIDGFEDVEQERLESASRLLESLERNNELLSQSIDQTVPNALARLEEISGTPAGTAAASVIGALPETENLEELSSVTEEVVGFIDKSTEIQKQFNEGALTRIELEEELQSLQEQTTENLEKQQSVQSSTAEGISEDVSQASEQYGELSGQVQTAEEFQDALNTRLGDFAEPLTVALENLRSVKGTLLAIVTSPLAALVALVGGAVTGFVSLSSQTQDFVEETGLAVDQARNLTTQINQSRSQIARFGTEVEEVQAGLSTLITNFGTLNSAAEFLGTTSEGVQSEITKVAGRLRIGGEEAAQILTNFEELAGLTGTTRQNLLESAESASRITDVPLRTVTQDLSENAEELATFSNSSSEELAAAAARARELGTNIGEVVDAQKKFLNDLPGQLQAVGEASALTGIQFDQGELAQSANEGTAAFQEALVSQFEGVDLQSLLPFQKQQIQEAFGFSISQIQRIKETTEATQGSAEDLADSIREGKVGFDRAFSETDAFTALQGLQNELSAAAFTLVEEFTPLFKNSSSVVQNLTEAVKASIPIFRLLGDGLRIVGEVVAFALDRIADFINISETFISSLASAAETMEATENRTASLASVFFGLVDATVFLANKTSELYNEFVSFLGIEEEFESFVSTVVGGFQAFASYLTGGVLLGALTFFTGRAIKRFFTFGDAVEEVAEETAESVGNSSKSIFEGLSKSITSFVDGLSDIINSVIDLVTSGLKTLLSGLGQAISAFGKALTPLVNPAVAGGIAVLTGALIGIGGAARLAAPAIDTLGEVLISLFDSLQPVLETLAGGVADLFRDFGEALVTLAEQAVPLADTFIDGFLRVIDQIGDSVAGVLDTIFSGIVSVANAGPQIAVAAGGITQLAAAFTTLTASGIIQGLTEFVGLGFVGQLEQIASFAEPLNIVGVAIDRVASGFEKLSEIDVASVGSELAQSVEDISGNEAVVEAIGAAAPQTTTETPTTTGVEAGGGEGGTDMSDTNGLLQRLVQQNQTLIQVIAEQTDINLDSEKVSKTLRNSNSANTLKSNI
jgi:phage-related protein